VKVQIDGAAAMAQYQAAFARLRALPGFDMKAVLRAETGSILKQWAGRTEVATEKSAEDRAWYRAGKRAFGDVGSAENTYNISVNTGAKGGLRGWVWYRNPVKHTMHPAGLIEKDGSFHPGDQRFSNEAWQGILSGAGLFGSHLVNQIPAGRESVGFARQAVVQIADKLGIDLAAVAGQGVSAAGVAKARKAIASNGRSYQNGTGTIGGDDTKCYVEALSRLPYGGKIAMDRELAGIIARRAKYIETSFRKGAMDSVRRAARAFPNIVKVTE
jgi:hypothetical protein